MNNIHIICYKEYFLDQVTNAIAQWVVAFCVNVLVETDNWGELHI
jgi:hypothetical protein